MGEMHCSECAEKLLFNRVWEGKDQRHGQVCLQGVIPPVPTLKRALMPLFEGSYLWLLDMFGDVSNNRILLLTIHNNALAF